MCSYLYREEKKATMFQASLTNVIVNQCRAETSQAHAVPTGHPALKRYPCLPSVVI